jgi:hypothetical protein
LIRLSKGSNIQPPNNDLRDAGSLRDIVLPVIGTIIVVNYFCFNTLSIKFDSLGTKMTELDTKVILLGDKVTYLDTKVNAAGYSVAGAIAIFAGSANIVKVLEFFDKQASNKK